MSSPTRPHTGTAEGGRQGSPGPDATAPAPEPSADPGPAPAAPAPAVDPVKSLMLIHHDLCADAVDPLEIAAGLEARGVTERTARAYRHRDVFALAEEMYARVPHTEDHAAAELHAPPATPRARGPRALARLLLLPLPAVLAAAGLAAWPHTAGRPRLALAAATGIAVLLALRACLRRGPLGSRFPAAPGTVAYVLLLLAAALYGEGLISQAISGGPDGSWAPRTAPLLALLASLVPAAACVRAFRRGAGRRLGSSRSLDDFAAAVWPLLLALFALYLCTLWGLLGVSAATLHQATGLLSAGSLGALLLLARLMVQHGRAEAARAALLIACAGQFLALASLFASRLPGAAALATPVERLTALGGTGAVPALACSLAVLTLLVRTVPALSRASAHAKAAAEEPGAPR
ncbi:hypothetical protein [Streptomyces sp. NPDC058426]|uniref:hypothetical protein n=1 Tax=Streptomyces sp. NPDC058426 TaxID=3346493 RepID=UPI00365B8F40